MNRSVIAKPSPRNPRRRVRFLVAMGLIAGLVPAMTWTVFAGMSSGSIQGVEGWSGGTMPINASVDQSVDQSGVNQRTGQGAWRISNKNYNGNFAGWVFGPGLPVSAGQPSSGAGADQFSATLWFRSANASADGSNIEIDLGTAPGDDRNTFLALTNRADTDGGLQLRVSEPDGATGDFRSTVSVATHITRSDWHRLDIVAKFVDGQANDTVEYALDGVALVNPVGGGTTFGTFEGYRNGTVGSTYALSNRLFFRSGAAPSAFGAAFVNTAAQGFHFDDLKYSVANQATPGSPRATYATGFEPANIPGSPQASYATGFEAGMSAGSIQSQEVWSGGTAPIAAAVDQSVDKSSHGRTGQGAWLISNKNYNGNFAGWVFGPGLSVTAGQPSSGADADRFTATLWFRSASPSADGSNLEIDLGTVTGDDRNTFLALTNRADSVGGLQLRASEPDGMTGNFLPTAVIAQNIERAAWHRLDIVATFHDGPANDTVEYALDGVALGKIGGSTTFGTFEGWRDGNQLAYALTNRLFFRSGAPASAFGTFSDSGVQGFYFDDLSYSAANRAPDLTVVRSHVGDFQQGQTGAQFAVTVTNSGSLSTSGVVSLTGDAPSSLVPTAAGGTGWTCSVAAPTVTCSRSDVLAPGASYSPITITVTVAANAPASVTSTATISGGGDVDVTNNTATDVATIQPKVQQVEPTKVDLAITKTDGRRSYTPGAAISYTITVTNAGSSSADGFSISDLVPAMISGVSVDCVIAGTGYCGTNGSLGNNVSVTGANLAAGAGNVLTLTVSGTVSAAASGPLVNTATVTAGAGSTDVNPVNNSATDTDRQKTGEMTEVASFLAYDEAFAGGVRVAVGDVTGDGVPEVITGAGPGGGPHVRAFSVAGGSVTEVAGFFAYDPAFSGGVSVAVGDVTGDGVAEVITGAGPGGGPHVRAFSLKGDVWTEVGGFFAYDPAFSGGVSVAVGDVNGDGVAEVITGAGPGGGPHVRAFSLSGGVWTEVAGFFAGDPAFPGGVSVAAADLTGDGVVEVITGAGPGGGPHVRAFSLARDVWTEVAGFFGDDPAFPGGVTVAAGDVTGDHVAEIITGAGPGGRPRVRVLDVSGVTIK